MTSINSTNVVHEYFSPFNFSTHAGYTGTLHSEVDGNSYFTKQNTWKTKNSYVLAILNIQQPKCTASPLLLSLQFRRVYYMGDIPMQGVKQFVEIRIPCPTGRCTWHSSGGSAPGLRPWFATPLGPQSYRITENVAGKCGCHCPWP